MANELYKDDRNVASGERSADPERRPVGDPGEQPRGAESSGDGGQSGVESERQPGGATGSAGAGQEVESVPESPRVHYLGSARMSDDYHRLVSSVNREGSADYHESESWSFTCGDLQRFGRL